MSVGVYKITNIITNTSYIGIDSHINKNIRYTGHFSCLINNSHYNKHLQKSFNKYGRDAFTYEVIFETYNTNRIYLDKLEKFFIAHFDTYKNGFNRTTGGYGNYKKEYLFKEAYVLDIETNIVTGGIPLKTLCKNIDVSYSTARFNIQNKTAYKNKLLFSYSPNINISEFSFKKPGMTPIEKKLSRRVTIKKEKGLKIYQFSIEGILIKEWQNIKLAAKTLRISDSAISNVAKGKAFHAGNFKWSYVPDKIPETDKKPIFYKKTH